MLIMLIMTFQTIQNLVKACSCTAKNVLLAFVATYLYFCKYQIKAVKV